jgi:tetratricopeptide (TPR) repeat protein
MDDAISHAGRLGMANLLTFSRNVKLWLLFQEGYWDAALPPTEEFLAACDAGEPHYHEGGMRIRRASVRLARDDLAGALEDIEKVLPLARRAGDPQQRVPWLAQTARLLLDAGRREEARNVAREALEPVSMQWALVDLALVADELGYVDELAELLENVAQTRWIAVMQASLRNDFAEAADTLGEIGAADLEAVARLRASERLVADGRRAEAGEQLQVALAFWRSVGATRYIRQAEALLSGVSEISA